MVNCTDGTMTSHTGSKLPFSLFCAVVNTASLEKLPYWLNLVDCSDLIFVLSRLFMIGKSIELGLKKLFAQFAPTIRTVIC